MIQRQVSMPHKDGGQRRLTMEERRSASALLRIRNPHLNRAARRAIVNNKAK